MKGAAQRVPVPPKKKKKLGKAVKGGKAPPPSTAGGVTERIGGTAPKPGETHKEKKQTTNSAGIGKAGKK